MLVDGRIESLRARNPGRTPAAGASGAFVLLGGNAGEVAFAIIAALSPGPRHPSAAGEHADRRTARGGAAVSKPFNLRHRGLINASYGVPSGDHGGSRPPWPGWLPRRVSTVALVALVAGSPRWTRSLAGCAHRTTTVALAT